MTPWVWMLLSVTLTAGAVWLIAEHLFSRRTRFLIGEREALARGIADAVLRLASLQQETLDRLAGVRERLEALAETPKAELWTGAFLPTDAGSAEMERAIRQSEDHAISATGPVRFSSQPSKDSAGRSGRAPSTQQGPTSGRR
jgi:hypothetical protein